jgi:DNA-binding beta-propeller fold protein YncE
MTQTRPRLRCSTRQVLLPLLLLLALGAGLLRATPAPAPALTLTLPGRPVAVTIATGHAFVLAADATLWRLDRAPDRLTRLLSPDPAVLVSSPTLALAARRRRLFVANPGDGAAPSVVHLIDSRTGAVLGAVRVGCGASALALDTRRGHLFVASAGDGTVSMLDASSGARLAATPVGLLPLALAVDQQTARAFVIGPQTHLGAPCGDSGGDAGLVSVLDTRSGTLRHVGLLGSWPDALAVDERTARVFVALSSGTVDVLDARDGTLLRSVHLGGQPTALAVDERRARVYVADAAAGALSLLDAASGTVLVTRRIDPLASAASAAPDALAVDAARDRVYLSTTGPLGPGPRGPMPSGNGTLYVLEARTGVVLWRIVVGVVPQAVAVEESSGRVVVVNGGGEVIHRADDWGGMWVGRLRAWLPWPGLFTPPAPSITRVSGSVSVIATAQ